MLCYQDTSCTWDIAFRLSTTGLCNRCDSSGNRSALSQSPISSCRRSKSRIYPECCSPYSTLSLSESVNEVSPTAVYDIHRSHPWSPHLARHYPLSLNRIRCYDPWVSALWPTDSVPLPPFSPRPLPCNSRTLPPPPHFISACVVVIVISVSWASVERPSETPGGCNGWQASDGLHRHLRPRLWCLPRASWRHLGLSLIHIWRCRRRG